MTTTTVGGTAKMNKGPIQRMKNATVASTWRTYPSHTRYHRRILLLVRVINRRLDR
jgi:hypothetical protein